MSAQVALLITKSSHACLNPPGDKDMILSKSILSVENHREPMEIPDASKDVMMPKVL